MFVSLYGTEFFMHFMLHYPEQIKAVGPMVQTWTIRHEAKLNFFNPLPTAHARYSAYRVTARYPRYRAVIASLAVARKRGLLSTENHLVGNLNLPEMMNYL